MDYRIELQFSMDSAMANGIAHCRALHKPYGRQHADHRLGKRRLHFAPIYTHVCGEHEYVLQRSVAG